MKLFSLTTHSFATRIIIILVLTMVIMAAVFDFFLIRMQQESYEKHVISDGRALTGMLARSVRLGIFSENLDELAGQSRIVFDRRDVVGVSLFKPGGDLLFRIDKEGAEGPGKVGCDGRLRGEIARSGSAFRWTEDTFVFWQPVFFDRSEESEEDLYFATEEAGDKSVEREIIGYAALVMSKEIFKKEKARIIYRTGLAVLIFLLISVTAVFAVINKMTRPLKMLLAKVKEKGGQASGDDIELLLTTYGRLLSDLEESFATINDYRENLEEQVVERTRELEERSRNLAEANKKLNETLGELASAQDQLVHSEKMAAMGRLVAGVAHEINNTVNFISGALPSLKRSLADVKLVIERYRELDCLSGDDTKSGLAKVVSFKKEIDFDEVLTDIDLLISNIEEGTNRTTNIIKDLRVFSHRGKEEWREVDLRNSLDNSLTFIDENLKQDVEIKRMYEDIPPVFCQQDRLNQVFLNLMVNSLQAMEGRGTMTIRTWREEDEVHISFTDTGCGIAGANLAKIFDPFFTTKDVGEGSGLGLGISYSIVKQHGGEIRVESKEGRGSLFEVILPAGGTGSGK